MLESYQAPIVLLRHLAIGAIQPGPPVGVCDGVAPGNPYLGVMLPYTPLHHLLMDAVGRPIICTSGNLSEEPMATATADAIERLGAIADVVLTHNRPIVRPVDDSVVHFYGGAMQVLRRARGFAPLPIQLAIENDRIPTILAVGGHLKNTVALLLGNGQVVMSAHVGDLESVASIDVFRRTAEDLLTFFRVVPDAVACDLHPDYASTRHARQLAAQWGVPLVPVQHHHAARGGVHGRTQADGAGTGIFVGRHGLRGGRDHLGW